MSYSPLRVSDVSPDPPLRRLGSAVHLFDAIPSTNTFLMDGIGDLPDGSVALAEIQTAGRGRLGRRWETPRGAAVLMSVLLMEDEASRLRANATMLAAVAACEALANVTDCDVRIRWPNDLKIGRKKLGGILAESRRAPQDKSTERPQWGVVIGIGLNCLQQARGFPPALAEKATSLAIESGSAPDRAGIVQALLARIDTWLTCDASAHEPWAQLHAAWRGWFGELGEHIEIEHGGHAFAGTVYDVVEGGDLILELDTGGRRQFDAATTTRKW